MEATQRFGKRRGGGIPTPRGRFWGDYLSRSPRNGKGFGKKKDDSRERNLRRAQGGGYLDFGGRRRRVDARLMFGVETNRDKHFEGRGGRTFGKSRRGAVGGWRGTRNSIQHRTYGEYGRDRKRRVRGGKKYSIY